MIGSRHALFRRFILGLCLSAATSVARAEGPESAPDASTAVVLPGCRAFVRTGGLDRSPAAQFCSGTIDALLYLGELLPPDYRYCVPLDIPREQVVQAVVEEIEAVYPAVGKQNFKGLVLDILHFRWRCRDLPSESVVELRK